MIAINGYAAKLMQNTQIDVDMKLSGDQAAIVFLRVGGAGSSPIAEYVGDNTMRFVGNMDGNSQILHITKPGKHEYVVAGSKSYVLKATLEGNKFYYVYVLPEKSGASKSMFIFSSLNPRDNDKKVLLNYYDHKENRTVAAPFPINSDSVMKWTNQAVWLKNTPKGEIWFENNKVSFFKKYQKCVEDDRIENLRAEYGLNSLIK